MPTPTEVRLKLRAADFDPIPVNGKRPLFAGWQKMIGVAEHEIERWARACPADENTGVLTARTPTFDIDILDPDAAQAVEDLVRELLEERGEILTRCGRWPKRAIPFRTDTPFAKIQVLFAGEKAEKLEFLGDGQQFVAHGVHPDTHEPYAWSGGELSDVARGDLPYIHEEEAIELVQKSTEILSERFGYQITSKSKRKAEAEAEAEARGNGGDGWGEYLVGVAAGDHDAMTRFAMALVNSGMEDVAAENFLHDTVTAYTANIDLDRLKRRLREIPAMVSSARKKLDAEEKGRAGAGSGAAVTAATSEAGAASPAAAADEGRPGSARSRRVGRSRRRNAAAAGWLLGHVFCKTFVSALVAPGGAGKTTVRDAQYLSLASGRKLTGEHVWKRCRVLVISLEDDRAEANRRFRAAMIHHEVAEAEVRGWLFVSAPGARVGKLMSLDRKGRPMRDIFADVIEAAIKRLKPDLIGLDPFVKAHAVNENDNMMVDMVIQILTDLATKHDIAIDLAHHVRKGPPDPGNADVARGASANSNASRLVYTLTVMNSEEAKRFSVAEEDRRSYLRMDSGKVNIAPPARKAKWFHIVGVPIGNPDTTYPDGDEAQTVEPWTPPEAFDGLDTGSINRILDDIDAGLPDGERYSNAPNAKTRAAWPVVERQAQGKPEPQCREVIKQWVDHGLLVSETYHSKRDRKDVEGLHVNNAKRPGTRSGE